MKYAKSDMMVMDQKKKRRRQATPTQMNKMIRQQGILNQADIRTERGAFIQTLHAVEPGDGSTFSGHLRRSPTVLWRKAETLALHALGRHVSAALISTSTPLPDLDVKGVDPMHALCYAPPLWQDILNRGEKGYGCAHARPPPGVRKNFLSPAQARLLEAQNGTARNLPHRTKSLVRNLRKKSKRAGHAGFSVNQFMIGLENQVGLRLVHVSALKQDDSGPPEECLLQKQQQENIMVELRLCYAMDVGGRFFVGLFWNMSCTCLTACWSDAWIESQQSLCQFYYACDCSWTIN